MDTATLERILASYPSTRNTVHVVPLDILLTSTTPGTFIVNNQPTGYKGEHWLAVTTGGDVNEFFDSLGHKPEFYSLALADFLTTRCKWSPKTIQSNTSNLCWAYCIYYCLKHFAGIEFDSIVNSFSNDVFTNDANIIHLL